jgi:hypothetical protein
MSQEVLVDLAKTVVRDPGYQKHLESLPDERLTGLGLDPEEIDQIRDGFFDRILRLGMVLDDSPPQAQGCCFS